MIRNCDFRDRLNLYQIDFFCCLVVAMVSFVSFCVYVGVYDIIIKPEKEKTEWLFYLLFYGSLLIGFWIYPIFKDLVFENGSLAKKIKKVKIIDEKTLEKPSVKKLILRNILYPLYPINLIFCKKRMDNRTLADIIFKTRVIYLEENKKAKEFNCE